MWLYVWLGVIHSHQTLHILFRSHKVWLRLFINQGNLMMMVNMGQSSLSGIVFLRYIHVYTQTDYTTLVQYNVLSVTRYSVSEFTSYQSVSSNCSPVGPNKNSSLVGSNKNSSPFGSNKNSYPVGSNKNSYPVVSNKNVCELESWHDRWKMPENLKAPP
jgi:hypothetical protein